MDGNLEGQLHNITQSDVRQLAETLTKDEFAPSLKKKTTTTTLH